MLRDFLLDPQYAIDRNNEGCSSSDEMKPMREEDESKLEEDEEKKRKENEEAGAASAAAPTATNGLPMMANENQNPDEQKDNYRLKYEDTLALTVDLQNKLSAEKSRADKLQTELAAEINRNSLSRRENILKSLREPAGGNVKLSLEKEMGRIQNMTDDQFNAHVEMIKENYAKNTDDDTLIFEGTIDNGGANPDRVESPKQDEIPEHVRIQRFAQENGIKNGREAVAKFYEKFPPNKKRA